MKAAVSQLGVYFFLVYIQYDTVHERILLSGGIQEDRTHDCNILELLASSDARRHTLID